MTIGKKERPIDERELRMRFYPPDQLTHVYRVGLATGTYKGACLAAERLRSEGQAYVELPFLRWIFELGPVCPMCIRRLAQEGIEREFGATDGGASNTPLNSQDTNHKETSS